MPFLDIQLENSHRSIAAVLCMVLLPLVVVDLEGTAAKIVVLAVSQPGLALIPIQGSQDAERAS